jgi:chromosome segregation ATPase
MELQRRETEAVEQVRQSVTMAEQISLEKTQLEHELGQVKQQLDRQQERIRNMIEENLDKIEHVRLETESRSRDEYSSLRQQTEQHAGQLGQLTTELEHCQRKETELRRQLKDQKSLTDQVQEDSELRLGQVQLEQVHLRSAKQQLEHQLECLRVDLEHSKSDLDSTSSRHTNEVESYKTRLTRVGSLLEECRLETLNLAETKSKLERELNLFKVTVSSQAGNADHQDNPITVNQLRTIVHRYVSMKGCVIYN